MNRAATFVAVLSAVGLTAVTACGGAKEPQPISAPAGQAGSSKPSPPAGASTSSPPSAAAPAGQLPSQADALQPIASTDVDAPTPLATKSIAGTGLKKEVSYYYSLSADVGTLTLTGTGKNAHAGMADALGAELLTADAKRLCAIHLGNTTTGKSASAACPVDKPQPLVLRVDLDQATIDFKVDLDGPVRLPDAGSGPPGAAAAAQVAGPGSTDIDAPTRLTGPMVKGLGTKQPTSYYYALNAGPGEVRLVADSKNERTAMANPLALRLVNLKSEEICHVTLGYATRDKRRIAICRMDAREPVILRVDLDPHTIDWRAKVEGAIDFEEYTPPKVVTIALNEKVLFDFGKSTLKPDSKQTLHEAADRVKKFATAKVTIAGHTDNVGSDAVNLKLSQDRAAAVRDFFVQQEAIPAARLEVKGFGKSQPIAENSTAEGRARNRRVEVVIDPK